MKLVQSRIVTDDVTGLARFYALLVGAPVMLNEYYVEVTTGAATLAFSRCRFTEYAGCGAAEPVRGARSGEVILDFLVDDVDAEFVRIEHLGVEWVLKPTTQPWGSRAMTFRDPEGNLVNVFSPVSEL